MSRSDKRGPSPAEERAPQCETFTPPEENEAVTRRVILSLSNPKGAAGGISSAHKTNSAKRKISLYVKFVGFPIWLAVIGFPHPPLRGPPSPKGRPTDTEAISFSLLFFLARSATHAEGVTLSTVH